MSYNELREEFNRVKNYEEQLRAYETELKEKATKLGSLIDSLQLPEDEATSGPDKVVRNSTQDLPAGIVEDAFGASFKPTSLRRGNNAAAQLTAELQRLKAIPVGAPAIGKISSHYGKRNSPFSGRDQFHQGLDISAPIGTKVFAPADGVIVNAHWDGAYGNVVEVDHGFGLKTKYAHLSKFTVNAGERIKRGQLLGAVGTTGRSTGPHLHYEITLNGKHLDPQRFVELAKEVKNLTTGA